MTTAAATALPTRASKDALHNRLQTHLRELHLPTVREVYEEAARMAEKEHLSFPQYLLHIVERECEVRRTGRIARLLRTLAFRSRKRSRPSSASVCRGHRMHKSRRCSTARSWSGKKTCSSLAAQAQAKPICSRRSPTSSSKRRRSVSASRPAVSWCRNSSWPSET